MKIDPGGDSVQKLKAVLRFFSNFKTIPSPLAVTAAAFLCAPLLSFFILRHPSEIFREATNWKIAVLIFSFWVGPLTLAVCAILKHKLILPVFLVECCAILLNTMLGFAGHSAATVAVQSVLIAAMLFFSYFLLRRDALYPLMHETSRAWRASPRIHVGLDVTLYSEKQKRAIKAVLQNYSMIGMEISAPSQQLAFFKAGRDKKDQIDFTLRLNSIDWDFTADLAWSHEDEGEQRLGLHISDSKSILAFAEALPKETKKHPVNELFSRYWQYKPFRQFALSLWAVLVVSAFLLPMTRKHISFQAHANTQPRLYMKAGLGPAYK